MKTLRPLFVFVICLLLMNVEAQIIHVPGDQPTIQDGIDAALFMDTILVADGHYFENIDFSGKPITVASEFIIDGDTNHINNTIIDGSQPSNPDNGSVVYFQNWEDTTSVLCGFTITRGTGTWEPSIQGRVSGGIAIENCGAKIMYNYIINNQIISSGVGSGGGIGVGDPYNNPNYVVIKYNRIKNNTVEATGAVEGGGIAIFCNGIITNNIISNNEISSQNDWAVGGGIRCYGTGDSRYVNCSHNIISYNTVSSGSVVVYGGAGGMQAYNCFGNISNNSIQFNETTGPTGSLAGGLHFGYCGTSMILENNLISKNTSNFENSGGLGGGVTLNSSNIQLINNVIVLNYAEKGGGIYNNLNLDGPTQFINNTIADNEGDGDGTAIYLEDADAIVLNSILWNDGNEIYVSGGSIEIAYSDVWGGWEGEGNIDCDPDFVPDDPIYHINGGCCHNTGIDEFEFGGITYYAPDKDYDGDWRPQGPYWDIGADECLMVGIPDFEVNGSFQLEINPNPSSGALHLRYQISETGYHKCELISMDGLLVKTLMIGIQQPGKYELEIDLSDLPNGLYLIRFQAGDRVETAKIILQK